MPRRPLLRTWVQASTALDQNEVSQAALGRYYGYDRRQVNNILTSARGIALPDSAGIWKAIDDIKRGVLVEPEGE